MDFKIQIDSIAGGVGSHYSGLADNQYLGANGIDPEGTRSGTAGVNDMFLNEIVPTNMSSFGGKISASAMWILSPGREAAVYTYHDNGGVARFPMSLSAESVLSASIGQSTGNGAVYYNNYLYFATSADVHRYGPLDSSPTMTLSAFTAGGGKTLSAACSYPGVNGLTYPNHPMHVHVDNKLYVGDFISSTGKACLDAISSVGAGISAGYFSDVLDLPFGYAVTDIESFGNDLAILAMPIGQYSTGAIPKTGKSALFLWDTFSSSFYRQVDISDPVATAMSNHNGRLIVFAGGVPGTEYTRILGYTGSNSFEDIAFYPEGSPPPAGAVDSQGNMLVYGSYGDSPNTFCGAATLNTRIPQLGPRSRNHILASPGNVVTSLAFVNQTAQSSKYPIIGWTNSGTSWGIDRMDSAGVQRTLDTNVTYWASKPYFIGQEFEITKIRLVLGNTVGTTTNVQPTIYVDHGGTSFTPNVISNTVYNGKQIIDLGTTAKGNVDFYIHLAWASTAPVPVSLPITIWGRTLRDN